MSKFVVAYKHASRPSRMERAWEDIVSTLLTIILYIASQMLACAQDSPECVINPTAPTLVGKIDDKFEITPTGQVSYEIPIKVATGTGGIEPKINISYNGSRHNGLCGIGFDLTGLSVINRTPANIHVDGRAGVVEINDRDCLMLDGKRLIQVADLGGGRKEWRTEQDSYSRIISEESDSLGPYRFTVQTKSGLTYHYDATDSPHADRYNPNGTSQTHFLFWLLKKVEDTSGNYYTVTYGTDHLGGEYWPERIDYTGNMNQNLMPYASLRFEYTINPDSTVSYIGGLRIRNCRLLSRIKAFYGESLVRRYTLAYQTVNGNKQLSSVTELGADGSRYPATTIQWGNVTDYTHNKTFHDGNVKQSHIITGDFNGDGIGDFCTLPKNSNALWDGWQLFCGSTSGQVSYESRGGLQVAGDVIKAVSGDFNGDGLDDLVIKRRTQNDYKNCDLYLADTVGGVCTLHFQKCIIVSQDDNYDIRPVVRKAEDGNDLFVYTRGSKNAYFLNAHPNLPLEVSYYPPQLQQKKWYLVRTGDFNGDGLTDIMNTNGVTEFLISDGTGSYCYAPYTISHQYAGSAIEGHLVGDLNGDGKSDILVFTKQLNNSGQGHTRFFYIHESTGNGFKRFAASFTKPGDCSLSLADINGDGLDDMVTFNNSESSSGLNAAFHINMRYGKQFIQQDYGTGHALDKWDFTLADFNGDGRADLLCTSNGTGSDWRGYWIYIARTAPDNQLIGVTDGLGNTTSVEYTPMTASSIHTSGHHCGGQVRSLTAPWPLVSRMTVQDGIGGTRSMTYHYHNALLHKRGRGVMGFEQTTVRDEATGTETVTHYKVDPVEFVMTPDRQTVTVNGRLIEETEMTDTLVYHYDHVFNILPKESTTWKYEYNTGELVAHTTTRQTFDDHGNVIRLETETPYKTEVNINTYDDDTSLGASSRWMLGRLVAAEVTKSDGTDTRTLHSTFEYDTATGLLIKETIEPDDTQLGSCKTYTRDGFGNIIRSVHRTNAANSQQRVTLTAYDDRGRFITATTDALGNTTHTTHDPLLCVPLTTVDANNDTTTYSYDGFGNLLTTETPLGKIQTVTAWSAAYGSNTCYQATEQATGQPEAITEYDHLGRAICSKVRDMEGNWIFTRTEYDRLGRVSRTSEPYRSGQTIQWNISEYDSIGRVIRQTDPTGNCYTMAYSGLTTVTTDPLGRSTTKTVDMEGNLVRSEDALGGTVEYEYDLNGKCTVVTGPRTTIVTEYDKMGNRTRLLDPDLGETTYSYNGFGELVSQTSGGHTTSYSHDQLGRVTWEYLDDYLIVHQYDEQWVGAPDRVITTSNNGGIEYTRDTHGRVISQKEYISGRSFITRFDYNALNQVEQITYPNNLRVRNIYSATGYLKQVRNAETGALYWQADATDARGQLEQFTLGNGLVTNVTHNAAKGHIERIATTGVQDFSCTFNEVGCLTGRSDNLRSLHETFAYDDLDRLVEVSHGGTMVQQLTYDAAGNITSKTGVGTQIGYVDGTNRVSHIRGADYVPVQWNEIRYTTFNKVKYVSYGTSTLQLSYGWDRQRKLAYSTVDGVTVKRYYAGRYYEQEERGDTVRQICYLYGSEGLFALVERKGGTDSVRYCHKDHLGSVVGYSDESGNLIQELSYDAWGRRRDPGTWAYLPTLASAGALDPHGFTGHEHLDLLEMVNMDGRVYDPVLGRFLSPDPLVQAPDFTQSLNRYAYCLNNPLSLTDPTGYSWFSRNWKSLVASVVGIAAAAFTGGASAGLATAVIAGAAGGASGAMVGAILNGQNFGQILKSTFQGALLGAMSGALNFACGDVSNIIARLAAHSVCDGFMEGLQGGNVLHGAMMGLLSAGSGEGMMAVGGSLKTGMKVAIQSVIGGTLSELGGGNFANGAITAAFSFLFNDVMHGDSSAQNNNNDTEESSLSASEFLAATALAMTADDVTGIGVADDVLVPIVLAAAGITLIYEVMSKPSVSESKPFMAAHEKKKQSKGGCGKGSSKRNRHDNQYRRNNDNKNLRYVNRNKRKGSERRRNKGKIID